ncbi:hypothetical protein ACFL2V_14105 [Pseudomonadota bacterium]
MTRLLFSVLSVLVLLLLFIPTTVVAQEEPVTVTIIVDNNNCRSWSVHEQIVAPPGAEIFGVVWNPADSGLWTGQYQTISVTVEYYIPGANEGTATDTIRLTRPTCEEPQEESEPWSPSCREIYPRMAPSWVGLTYTSSLVDFSGNNLVVHQDVVSHFGDVSHVICPDHFQPDATLGEWCIIDQNMTPINLATVFAAKLYGTETIQVVGIQSCQGTDVCEVVSYWITGDTINQTLRPYSGFASITPCSAAANYVYGVLTP